MGNRTSESTEGYINPIATKAISDLIVQLSPTVDGQPAERPDHLEVLLEEIEAGIAPHAGQRFFWFSVPPRHWKSVTLKHAIVKHLLRWPESGVAYCTHTQSFASKQSRDIRRIARAAGLDFSTDSNRKDEWELSTGGGLVARGVGGELTGRGFRLIVVDDPVKGREQAESQVERQKIDDWIEDDVITRLTPDGVVWLVHTRWHPDDPIGRRRTKSSAGWRGQNIQALTKTDDGSEKALLPHHWSAQHLQKIRDANPLRFASLYQGEPRPRGGKVFNEPHWYDPREIPRTGYTVAHGCDLAYSAKTHADQSVLVSGIAHGGFVYLVNSVARRCLAHEFAAVIADTQKILPGDCRWYCSTTERGTAHVMTEHGANIVDRLATADKFVRAQPVANAWNQGKVLLPGSYVDEETGETIPPPDWVTELLEEVGIFTGVGDRHDDHVDALAAMYDQLIGDIPVETGPTPPVQHYHSPLA